MTNSGHQQQPQLTMSFFKKLMTKVSEVVQDDFTHQLQLHQVIAIINRQQQSSHSRPSHLERTNSINAEDLFKQIQSINEFTPQIEFRMLGYEPNVETIDGRVKELKVKLSMVETYLMEHSQEYLTSINSSLVQLPNQKDFYSGRIRSQELRNIIGKLKQVLDYSRTITRLNIRMKNIKSTIKILEKIPNIKKMNLIELKTINKQSLTAMSQELLPLSPSRTPLLCVDNLFNYITKVNNEEFIYIIDKIKLCLEDYDSTIYEEVIRNYIVIAPGTPLQKLLVSLLEEKIRLFYDVNVEKVEGIVKIGNRVVGFMTNLHKIIKWHRNNKAVHLKNNVTANGQGRRHRLSVDSAFLSGLAEQQIRNRCISIDSVYSDEGQVSIEINQTVVVDPSALKAAFSRTIDSCMSDLTSDYILTEEVDFRRFYQYTYLLSKISEVCYNFTGLTFDRLRKIILDHCSRREFDLFAKNAKELVSVLELQKNEWNRLPFDNNYQHKGLDKLIYGYEKMCEKDEFRRVTGCVNKLFHPRERDLSQIKKFLQEEDDSEEDQDMSLQFSHTRLPTLDKVGKEFDSWQPEKYLCFNEGDAILCQSSFKLLAIFEKHFQFLTLVPQVDFFHSYLSRLLIFSQYYTYYIFMTFLSPTYKTMFFETLSPSASVDKRYTKSRLTHLYPQLSVFVCSFRGFLQEGRPDSKWYAFFRRDIKQMQSDNTQALRAKVVATEACRYILAYADEIIGRLLPKIDYKGKSTLLERLENGKVVIKELSTILLTESSQKMVGLELQTMRSLFQTIRWRDPYADLKEYMSKFTSLIRQSFDRLKSSNRGQIPINLVQRISVLIWRTLMTYSIKLFLQNKNNSPREAKANFEKFIEQMHFQFVDPNNRELAELTNAYETFKGIFRIVYSQEWEQCRERLLETVRRKEYIYGIVIALLENAECLKTMSQKEREGCRKQLRQEIQVLLES